MTFYCDISVHRIYALKFRKSCQSFYNMCYSLLNILPVDRKKRFISSGIVLQSSRNIEPPWKIMFFGTDSFSVRSLEVLCSKLRTKTLISKLDVTTKFSNTSKEQNQVYQFAKSEKLKIINWPVSTWDIKDNYDLGIVVSFGHMISEDVILSFPLGILNVHGSLLPRWRGAAPVIYSILNGDSETGITVAKINPLKFDTGDIVRQYGITIHPHETAKDLTSRLSIIGANLLMEVIRDLPRSIEYADPQSNEGISYAKKVTTSMAKIHWNEKTAEEIYNQYRALAHIYPLHTNWFTKSIKFRKITLDKITIMNPQNQENLRKFSNSHCIIPGLVEYSSSRSLLRVQCKDGRWICITDKITVGGKKPLSPIEFYNGFMAKIAFTLNRKFVTIKEQ